jgi:hypothetical protein
MKYFVQIFLVLSSLSSAVASSLPQQQAAADAKWLLHIDVAQFRSTKVGDFVIREILQKKLSKPLADLKKQFKIEIDTDKILEKVTSITAYGTQYKSPENSAVLLIRADPDLEKIFLGMLAGLSLAGSNASAQVEQTQIGEVTFYAIHQDTKDMIFFALLPGKVVAVGKSRGITEQAAKVLAGKSPNLTSSKAFSEFADIKKSFFFLGVAEGFSADTVLPPQARLLQLADGGRVVLGENADQLYLNLALRAKNSEITTQMQQVIQGVIALSSLGQPENKDLTQLVQSVKTSTDNKTVNVSLEFPVEKALQQLAKLKDRTLAEANAKEAAEEKKD